MTELLDRRYCFAWTLSVIVLAYLIMFAVLPKESIWISDEGNRIMSVQAYGLNGSKALPDPLNGITNIPSGIRAYPFPYFIQKNGQWRSAYQLFFPWLASWVYSDLGRTCTLFIAVLGGLLTVLGTGLLARKLFGDDLHASLAMVLCAFCTPVWFYSETFLETTCASAFAVLSLWLLLEAKESKGEFRKIFGCGILAGISILFREEGFIFAAGTGLALLIWYFSWKRVLAYGLGAALAVIPLLIYNYIDSTSIFGMHHFVYSQLPKAAGSLIKNQLLNYSFYLFLLCLPFWGQLNLVLPWVLLGSAGLAAVPKIRRPAECLFLSAAIVCCGASTWCNIMTPHGGAFIYQSLLDHVPLFALFLLCLPVLFRSDRKEIRFLTVVTLAGIFLPPALLNHDQPGMFWGGRHFLDIVPLLCILSVHLLLRTGEQLSRAVRTGGWLLVILSLAANVSGYAVLNAKRNFSAEYVRETAKPEYQVILTDMYWMPEELAWIHREKCVLLMLNADSLDQVRPFLRANGIPKFHLLLGRNYRKITNESVQRTIDECDFKPGRHFSHPMFGFFECQLFECTFRKPSGPWKNPKPAVK